MQCSQYTPRVVYINISESVLFPISSHDRKLRRTVFSTVRETGLAWLMSQSILAAASIIMTRKNLTIPIDETKAESASKAEKFRINKEREEFVSQILKCLTVRIDKSTVVYFFEEIDITAQVHELPAERIAFHQTWMQAINSFVATLLEQTVSQEPILYIATDSPRLITDTMNPVIGIIPPAGMGNQEGRTLRLRKRADVVLEVSNVESGAARILATIQEFTDLREQRARLYKGLRNGTIKLEPQFERETWPGHPLVAQLKTEVRQIVHQVIGENASICDPLDLEYQTLFRLTSLPVESVFENGKEAETYLQSKDAYGYWRNILTLEPEKLLYKPKVDIVEKVVREQLRIIMDRLHYTNLPIDDLIQQRGIFAEKGWKLRKHGGSLSAIKVENGIVIDKREVAFKPVGTSYAKELHAVLHYIHTPRAKKAFGLYLENESLPFSVVAFDEIDRPYKKDLLLMLGYHPDRCLDLARLYSKPGTPFNTSSTIFTLAFAYFREFEPEIQAVLSAFMPTYAHGMSMISAGFNYGSLVKEWRHSFAEREIEGEKAWELVTKRRKEGGTQQTIDSVWPLLPVFELFVPIRPPRFTPFQELNGMMVSRDL